MPFSDVAFGAGFESIRQFNQTVKEVFDVTPTELRGRRSKRSQPHEADWISLRLPGRQPYDSGQVLGWLGSHAVAGVEEVEG